MHRCPALPSFLAFLFGACLASCQGPQTPQHHAPRALDTLGDGRTFTVEHAPGQCQLCDLYHEMRERVVLIRAGDSLGAGVLVDAAGLVVTNAHVVGTAAMVSVETADGVAWRGTVRDRNEELDLAIVALPADSGPWPAAALDLDGEPAPGSSAFVLGHPLGLGWTITQGIVSAVRRPGEFGPVPMIQTDAAISPGNSGGPLLDAEGHVLGIVTVKLVSRGSESLAFAIPAAVVRRYLAATLGRAPAGP